MATLAAQMTKEGLIQLIESTIERKLLELFDDLDAGLELKQAVRDRLLHQQARVAQGEWGHTFQKFIVSPP